MNRRHNQRANNQPPTRDELLEDERHWDDLDLLFEDDDDELDEDGDDESDEPFVFTEYEREWDDYWNIRRRRPRRRRR